MLRRLLKHRNRELTTEVRIMRKSAIVGTGKRRLTIDDESGSILILTALSMAVLLGIAALAIDVSFMYDRRNILSAAADAAAKSAAIEVHLSSNPSSVPIANLQAFANQQVSTFGLTPAACGTASNGVSSVCVHHPPSSGPFAGNFNYVEAVVSEQNGTFFGRILGWAHLTPGARAVAGTNHSTACLTTLASGNPGITVSNPVGSITATTCDVLDGGNMDANNITARSIGVTGPSVSCSGCSPAPQQAPSPSDPLAGLPPPSAADCNSGLPGTDVSVTGSAGAPTTLTPGTYRNLTFNGYLQLAPGLYCVTGSMTANNPGSVVNIRATGGVTIYLGPSAQMTFDSNKVDVALQGQTSGVYKGIVFYQHRGNSNPAQLAKNTGPWNIEGVMYFPSATIEMKNANFAASNQCGLIVAGAVNMDKPDLVFDARCGGFGGSPILSVSIGE